jgi:hypothetical protein
VPIAAVPGIVTVESLAVVDLAMLEEIAHSNYVVPDRAVTEKS